MPTGYSDCASGKINEIPQFRWWGKNMNDKRLKRNRAKIKKSQCLLGLYRIKQETMFYIDYFGKH